MPWRSIFQPFLYNSGGQLEVGFKWKLALYFLNGSLEFWEDKFTPITGEVNVTYILPSFSSGAILNLLDTVNLLTYFQFVKDLLINMH